MKHKLREIDDPWEHQIACWISNGTDPETARLATIILWADAGDLQPLLRAITEAPKLDGSEKVAIDGAILGYIARLINEDRLIVKPRRRGAPRSPDKFVRDLLAILDYEKQRAAGKSSNAARKDVCRKYEIMTSDIIVSKDLFNLANADDSEKLELARIGLIDLSVSDLIAISQRARAAIADNPRLLAKVDRMRAKNAALAIAMLERQEAKRARTSN
jgi:hypothetical protein